MPLYAYRCTQCGYHFEKIQHFSARQEHECPKCHGVLERPLTAPRLKFKGSGWYVNDYAAKSSASGAASGSKSETAAATTEAKTPCGGSCGAACPVAAPAAPSGSTT